MHDPIDDTPIGIQRIALTQDNGRIVKVKRMALGCLGAVKLWPANGQLVVGEGLERCLPPAPGFPTAERSWSRPGR